VTLDPHAHAPQCIDLEAQIPRPGRLGRRIRKTALNGKS
jgi:hypothetical protein